MKDPNIKTKVVHSKSNLAWNVVGENLANKFKIARIPYILSGNKEYDLKAIDEAHTHAIFISTCFNNSFTICRAIG